MTYNNSYWSVFQVLSVLLDHMPRQPKDDSELLILRRVSGKPYERQCRTLKSMDVRSTGHRQFGGRQQK